MRGAFEKVKNAASLNSAAGDETVEFLCPPEWAEAYPEPVPAASEKPDWLTNLHDPPGERDPSFPGTVQRCMAFLQAMNLGWILRCPVDIGYKPTNGGHGLDFGWGPEDTAFIEPFDGLAVGGDEFPVEPRVMKFSNKWVINTPPGYSSLITHPFNQPDPRFQALSGVIETDKYDNYAHVPFLWHGDTDEQGVIERGTPIAQVIPYKRDSLLEDAVAGSFDEEDELAQKQAVRRIQAADGYYQEEVWEPHGSTRVRKKDE